MRSRVVEDGCCGIEVVERVGRTWNWSCACGSTGRGRTEAAAQRDAADHVARGLLQSCARARKPLVALAGAESELHSLLDVYRHANSRQGAA